jgi:hypothetical protein
LYNSEEEEEEEEDDKIANTELFFFSLPFSSLFLL